MRLWHRINGLTQFLNGYLGSNKPKYSDDFTSFVTGFLAHLVVTWVSFCSNKKAFWIFFSRFSIYVWDLYSRTNVKSVIVRLVLQRNWFWKIKMLHGLMVVFFLNGCVVPSYLCKAENNACSCETAHCSKGVNTTIHTGLKWATWNKRTFTFHAKLYWWVQRTPYNGWVV